MNYTTGVINLIIMSTPIIGMLLIGVGYNKYFFGGIKLLITFSIIWLYCFASILLIDQGDGFGKFRLEDFGILGPYIYLIDLFLLVYYPILFLLHFVHGIIRVFLKRKEIKSTVTEKKCIVLGIILIYYFMINLAVSIYKF